MIAEDEFISYATIAVLKDADKKKYSSKQAEKRMITCGTCGMRYDRKGSSDCPLCQLKTVFLDLQRKYDKAVKFQERQGTRIAQLEWTVQAMQKELDATRNAENNAAKTAGTARFSDKTGANTANESGQVKFWNMSSYRKGDRIKFGRFHGDAIEWTIMKIVGNRLLLLSKDVLEFKGYHNKLGNVTWETSSLRRYLNNEFLKNAFNDKERTKIAEVRVVNSNNKDYKTSAGNDTRDRIFLLSVDEANRLFANDYKRICRPSEYAKTNVGLIDSVSGACRWWLRSPGSSDAMVASVTNTGRIVYNFDWAHEGRVGVRPAMWLEI